ncbi:MAG: acid phosphatase [Bacteroidetes bacterium]|nr:acid phosphatase [Bacteroidota bacterium]
MIRTFALASRRRSILSALTAAAIAVGCGSCSKDATTATTASGINKVNHIIVVYMENHSFDNLYGEYPGANGIANATAATKTQIDTATGQPYTNLPPPPADSSTKLFPKPIPGNGPFNIDTYATENVKTADLVHRYYQEQMQIDGGKMDKFAAVSDAKGLSMGYYHTASLPMYPIVQQYTLCDNFFHSAFGGSYLNHMYMISAAAPIFSGATTGVAQVDANGKLIKDGAITPDGYVVNTSFSVNSPHPASANPAALVPNQTMPTIGDRLSEKNISWAWYSGKWSTITGGTATHADSSLFQFHHQPFAYFANYKDGTAARTAHLKDETDFMTALSNGTLPAVSFLKPYGNDNEHPGYTDLMTGETYLVNLVNKIKSSPIWNDCVVVITYDEHGGFWDHVAPPVIDKWGPGIRVPGIIISPFSKQGVDHTQYETLSILAFIEKRYGLSPLGTRDAAANPFSGAFNF